jgi:hypothetical protein
MTGNANHYPLTKFGSTEQAHQAYMCFTFSSLNFKRFATVPIFPRSVFGSLLTGF